MAFSTPQEAATRNVQGRERRVLATAISPDGLHAIVLWEDGKRRYLLVSHCMREASGWVERVGPSSAGDIWTSNLGDDHTELDLGVLSVSGDAPPDATAVLVRWSGDEHLVPVLFGRFLFVAWDVPASDHADVVAFIDASGKRRRL